MGMAEVKEDAGNAFGQAVWCIVVVAGTALALVDFAGYKLRRWLS